MARTVVERDISAGVAGSPPEPQRAGVLENPAGLDDGNLAFRGLLSPPERLQHLFCARSAANDLDCRRDPSPHFVRFADHAGTQQGLEGMQPRSSSSAEYNPVDERDLQSPVGGQKRAAYPPGPPPSTIAMHGQDPIVADRNVGRHDERLRDDGGAAAGRSAIGEAAQRARVLLAGELGKVA
jgi:hypothetical protein